MVDRVRTALGTGRRIEEKRMFGGTAFMVGGKMCVSVGKARIMCRIDPAIHDAALIHLAPVWSKNSCDIIVVLQYPAEALVSVLGFGCCWATLSGTGGRYLSLGGFRENDP